MAFIEGGGVFKCGTHEFETTDIEEFNEHCLAYPDIHFEVGETGCMNCGKKVYFDNLPYHPIDPNTGSKNISIRCEECETRIMGNVRIRSVKQVEDKDLV